MYLMGWVRLPEQHYSKTRHWFNAFADNAMIFTIIEVKFMSQTLHYCTYWAWNQGIIGKWEWKKKILKTVTKANDGTSLFHNILICFPFLICLFSSICLQSSVDIWLQPNDNLLGWHQRQILQSWWRWKWRNRARMWWH